MITAAGIYCQTAAQHYFSFLQGAIDDSPCFKAAQEHIRNCWHCRQETERLAAVLGTADPGAEPTTARRALNLHYQYIDCPVDCRLVGTFLPSLLLPECSPRVATPITVHIDHCPRCRGHLRTLSGWNLNPRQLRRLAELLTASAEAPPIAPTAAPAATAAGATACRGRAFAELFDSLAGDETAAPVGEHVRNCPACRARLQTMRRHIQEMAHDAGSAVKTVFRVGHAPAGDAATLPDSAAVTVEVCRGATAQPVSVSTPAPRWQVADILTNEARRVANRPAGTRRLLRPLAVAAAVAAVLGLMVVFTRSAGALGLDQISRAFLGSANVAITRYAGADAEPSQRVWISRPRELRLVQSGGEWVVWDVGGQMRRAYNQTTGQWSHEALTSEQGAALRETLHSGLTLMPFDVSRDLPRGASWREAKSPQALERVPGAAAYELEWRDDDSFPARHKLWRVYVNPVSHLPVRVELYGEAGNGEPGAEYELLAVQTVEYIRMADIEALLEELGF